MDYNQLVEKRFQDLGKILQDLGKILQVDGKNSEGLEYLSNLTECFSKSDTFVAKKK